MESAPQSLTALLRGSPWYESALRGARAERAVVLWLRLGARSRLEGFVGQVVARDGSLVGEPLIGGTVWSSEHGTRGPVLDGRRRELADAWAEIERRLGGRPTVVGHRLATLRTRILAGLPPSMRGPLSGATWVDLHEAASLLRRSRLADATGRSLLEVRSASLRDLAAIAGERVSEEQLASDDLRAAQVAVSVWAGVLLPRFGRIPVVSDEPADDRDERPGPAVGHGALPRDLADLLDAPLEPDPIPSASLPGPADPPAAAPVARSYRGQPDGDGWTIVRDDGLMLAGVLHGRSLAHALLADLAGGEPEAGAVDRLTERVIAGLPPALPFVIGEDDLRALSA